MDLKYKIQRVFRWGKRIGLLNALSFEIQQTVRRPIIVFRHGGIGRKIHLRSGSSDVAIFEHVFIEDEFDIDLEDPKLIIDGGANCGLATVSLAHSYPGAKIVSVEPSSENCTIARRNIAGLNAELVQTALWSRSTHLKIENTADAAWAFRCVEANPEDPDAFQATDMETLLAGRQCDLLKLDIEGAETELFRDPVWLKDVAAVVVETHGPEAERMILDACQGWKISQTGEKIYLNR